MCHLVTPQGHPGDAFLQQVAHELHHRFDVGHATVQIELAQGSCSLQCESTVNARVNRAAAASIPPQTAVL